MKRKQSGFTLTEVLIAASLMTVVVGITLVAFVALLKRNLHTDQIARGGNEIRYSFDFLTKSVRASPIAPIITNSGCTMEVAPNEFYYATVAGTTNIDPLRGIQGAAAAQKTIVFSDKCRQPAAKSILTGACPSSSVSSPGSTFLSVSDFPSLDVADFFQVGDVVTIPATIYGGAQVRTIQSITNTSSTKSITFTTNLTDRVPNGTQIAATALRRMKFEVTSGGQLRYYRDSTGTNYRIIAENITQTPRVDAYDTSSPLTQPFTYYANATLVSGVTVPARTLRVNLQRLPVGSTAGRTELGLVTSILLRTDPASL